MKYLVALADVPPFRHVTVTGHEPGVVRVPTFQVQLTNPVLLAVLLPSPAAFDGPEAYSTTIEQAAEAAVLTDAVA